VHRRGEWRGERPAEQRPGIAILAEHNKPDLLAAALAGVAKLPDDVMAFIDEEASGNGRVWKLAGQLGIRDRVDVVPSLEGNRELALRCDVLAAPGPTGRHRSVVLDAMAAGVAVVGIRDPLIEALNTPDFAWLLDEDEPDAWADAFREALGYTESARDRRIAAKSFVDEQRRPFAHIGGLLDVYTALTAPETIRFAQAR
jgi:glycosyltransferase involved in cell wall biosynthesis